MCINTNSPGVTCTQPVTTRCKFNAKEGSSFTMTDKFHSKDDQEQRLSAKGFHGNKQDFVIFYALDG